MHWSARALEFLTARDAGCSARWPLESNWLTQQSLALGPRRPTIPDSWVCLKEVRKRGAAQREVTWRAEIR